MTDNDLTTLLESLEGPMAPGPDVDDRVFARMNRALDEPADTATAPDAVTLLSRQGRREARPLQWAINASLIAAACVAVVVAAAIAIRPGDTDPLVPTEEPVASVTPSIETTPTSVPATQDSPGEAVDTLPANVLGYQPFASTGFWIGALDAMPDDAIVLERVGAVTSAADGFRASVRRTVGPELANLDVVIRPDGAAIVPIEFIDPSSRGGSCVGGSIVIRTDVAETFSTEAECAAGRSTVTVTRTIGVAEQVELLDATQTLLPVTYTLAERALSRPVRTVTLWHEDGDLVWLEPGDITITQEESP